MGLGSERLRFRSGAPGPALSRSACAVLAGVAAMLAFAAQTGVPALWSGSRPVHAAARPS
jgi:hypothetical protein